jgi:hypothetical protein
MANVSYEVFNDSPVWLKPRRCVWWIRCPNGLALTDKRGRNRYFRTQIAAERALSLLQLNLKEGFYDEKALSSTGKRD